ncbi:hypothetical protein N480_05430 [Pseudoalteromonas luteoviolacea S2607]|uniref:Uncharacterized protein n=1 Tax=Pseudoalteromonas luteoviolacea S4060-1 TaxID=1365257 RepID=A0A167JNR8_9GAMM|nr:hypothetical protein N480_05430 [Pseudoalteromonas luteoviolacea S2607]KZN61433.1 hypothetical protein N478_05020 [Pseudoalteromonas luteoviolacea S4060-1]
MIKPRAFIVDKTGIIAIRVSMSIIARKYHPKL